MARGVLGGRGWLIGRVRGRGQRVGGGRGRWIGLSDGRGRGQTAGRVGGRRGRWIGRSDGLVRGRGGRVEGGRGRWIGGSDAGVTGSGQIAGPVGGDGIREALSSVKWLVFHLLYFLDLSPLVWACSIAAVFFFKLKNQKRYVFFSLNDLRLKDTFNDFSF